MTLPEFGRDSSITHDKPGGRFGSQISQMMWCHVVSCHVIRICVLPRAEAESRSGPDRQGELKPSKKRDLIISSSSREKERRRGNS